MSDLYLLTVTIKLIYFDHSIAWKHSSSLILDQDRFRLGQKIGIRWPPWALSGLEVLRRRREWS